MIEKYVDAEELKRLLSVLFVILGGLIIAGLFASIVVPGLRNANKPATPTAVAPVVGESGWLNPEEFPPQRGGVVPPVDPQTLLEPSAALIERGETLFENNCTQCHGRLGRGDGPAAATMNPKPRDLADSNGWKKGFEVPGIFKTLTEGISGTSMASFDYFSKRDRMALTHYVQSLGKFDHKAGNSEAIEALATELAAAGETIPNKIPLSMAMVKLRLEYIAPPSLTLTREDQSPGAEILQRVLIDPERAGRFLALSQSWKSSYRAFASSVLLDTPGNGFSINSATLNESEWRELYAELLKRAKSQ
jgi:mono/diheme cytochrome c family protein